MIESGRMKVNSLLVASVIAETNICAILSAFVTIPKVSVLLMGILFLIGVIINKNSLRIKSISIVGFLFFVLLLLVSIPFNGLKVPGERLLYLISFGFTAMVIVSTKYNNKLVIKYLAIIYAIHLLVYFLFLRDSFLDSNDYWSEQMGVAYGFVPAIIICTIFLLYLRRFVKEKIFGKRRFIQVSFLVIVLLVSGYVVFIDCATRGAIVVTFVGLFFILFKKLSHKQKVIFSIAGAAFITFIFLNWNAIVGKSLERFSEGNVKSLVKLSRMEESGDISNGREDHYNQAIKMIGDNPILGYGVGYYENHTKTSYPHQLFLELMLECGLLGSLLFLKPIMKMIKRTRKDEDEIEYSFKILLLSCCFLPLMFSASFWLYPPFWYGYFYSLNCRSTQQPQFATSAQ